MNHPASRIGYPRSRAGFSLVEVMISLFIFTIIASMAAGVFIWCMRAAKSGSSQINYITEARLAQEKILKYIYMGNKLKGLSHTATSLRIQMDYNADKAYEEAEIRFENRGAGKADTIPTSMAVRW
jgi:prepilin-type N-terminal cleavage/methylation domain-containing protein